MAFGSTWKLISIYYLLYTLRGSFRTWHDDCPHHHLSNSGGYYADCVDGSPFERDGAWLRSVRLWLWNQNNIRSVLFTNRGGWDRSLLCWRTYRRASSILCHHFATIPSYEAEWLAGWLYELIDRYNENQVNANLFTDRSPMSPPFIWWSRITDQYLSPVLMCRSSAEKRWAFNKLGCTFWLILRKLSTLSVGEREKNMNNGVIRRI